MHLNPNDLCWCKSGKCYKDCHFEFDRKLNKMKNYKTQIPPHELIKTKEDIEGIKKAADEKGVFVAAQCCEHLNRAIIVERKAVPGCEFCNVVPQPKAGGSFATAAYKAFECPVALEEIKADAGLDIGFTMIGMHLKKVAVPVRLKNNKIGEATVLAARVRAKFIGGERACYDDRLM